MNGIFEPLFEQYYYEVLASNSEKKTRKDEKRNIVRAVICASIFRGFSPKR